MNTTTFSTTSKKPIKFSGVIWDLMRSYQKNIGRRYKKTVAIHKIHNTIHKTKTSN